MQRCDSQKTESTRQDVPTWPECEDRIRAFERAWLGGKNPDIEEYLDAGGPIRFALLVELVHIDLELRLKAGQAARIEEYIGRYPELAADDSTLLGLIAAEFDLRRRRDSGLGMGEYQARFPNHAEEALRHRPEERTFAGPTLAPGAARGVDTRWPEVPGYAILDVLGRGGMGVVYRARDARLGRLVALKFLPMEYARDADRMARFLREARTASALNHPHICTVHALDEHDGRPFIVMEFIEGRTLKELAASCPGLELIAHWVGQAARALAVAHAAGVVHRDIKPENIMVREDGYVKVLDFGLARQMPALAATVPGGGGHGTDPGALLGTVAYMSPEQARGDPADSASDIFSLGIVLYQMVTGKHPFDADTPLAIMQAIASCQAVSPARLNPELPPLIERLIGAMLQQHAPLRPTAAEVETILARMNTAATAPPARPAGSGSARMAVGRQSELATLRSSFAQADAGNGVVLCVAGEPGIGKTTLVEGFLRDLAESMPDCLIARGRCAERLAGAEAYLPVVEALEDLLRSAGGRVARLLKVVAPSWFSLAASAAAAPATNEGAAAQAGSQQALKREFRNFLEETSRLGPIVLFFDDVHWADVSTVDLLAHLGRHCHGLRVLVLLTHRTTELLLGPHPLHPVKLELQGRGVCREVPLGFLTRHDIDNYLDLTFPGHGLPEDFAELIHARTEGNPLFMADLLRYLREKEVIAERDGRWALAREVPDVRQELPESVRSMIQRKIEQLAETDRRLLAAASVQGQEFDSAVVAGALELDAAEVEEKLHSRAARTNARARTSTP